jgi:hypothetical protein
VKTLGYSRYDINGYCFRTAELEASRLVAATSNHGVVTSDEGVSGCQPTTMVFLKTLLSIRLGRLRAEGRVFNVICLIQ